MNSVKFRLAHFFPSKSQEILNVNCKGARYLFMRMRTKDITLTMTEAKADVITFENTCIDSTPSLIKYFFYLTFQAHVLRHSGPGPEWSGPE